MLVKRANFPIRKLGTQFFRINKFKEYGGQKRVNLILKNCKNQTDF